MKYLKVFLLLLVLFPMSYFAGIGLISNQVIDKLNESNEKIFIASLVTAKDLKESYHIKLDAIKIANAMNIKALNDKIVEDKEKFDDYNLAQTAVLNHRVDSIAKLSADLDERDKEIMERQQEYDLIVQIVKSQYMPISECVVFNKDSPYDF